MENTFRRTFPAFCFHSSAVGIKDLINVTVIWLRSCSSCKTSFGSESFSESFLYFKKNCLEIVQFSRRIEKEIVFKEVLRTFKEIIQTWMQISSQTNLSHKFSNQHVPGSRNNSPRSNNRWNIANVHQKVKIDAGPLLQARQKCFKCSRSANATLLDFITICNLSNFCQVSI